MPDSLYDAFKTAQPPARVWQAAKMQPTSRGDNKNRPKRVKQWTK